MWDASTELQPEWLPVLDIAEQGRQRRLTVLLRLLLLVPQFVVLWVLSIVAFVVTVLGWFGALFLGRLPTFAASFLSTYLAYETRVYAYLMLLVDRYPPFQLRPVQYPTQYPVRIELRPGTLNRAAVFFRLVLMIPAVIIQSVLFSGWWLLAFFCWLVVLIAGRVPEPLFGATAAVLRYRMRAEAYMLMLTSAYPKRLFGDAAPPAPAPAWAATGPGPEAGAAYGQGAGAAADAGQGASYGQGAGYGQGAAAGWQQGVAADPGAASAPGAVPGAAATVGGGAVSATRPLLLGTGAKVLLVVFIVAGLGSYVGGSVGGSTSSTTTDDTGTVSTVHRLPAGP